MRATFLLLLSFVVFCFGKIFLLNKMYGPATSIEVQRAAELILRKQNVELYQSQTPFTLKYSDGGIPYLTETSASLHGQIILSYGVTIDSFSQDRQNVYYKPYVSQPYVDLQMDTIESSVFDYFSAEDYRIIRNRSLANAPRPEMKAVCDEFEEIVTKLSRGAITPRLNKVPN